MENGGKLTITLDTVDKKKDPQALIVIRDEGKGIDEKNALCDSSGAG